MLQFSGSQDFYSHKIPVKGCDMKLWGERISWCSVLTPNREKGPGGTAGNGILLSREPEPEERAQSCHSHPQFHIFQTRESSVEGILANICTWRTKKIGNEEVVANPGRGKQSFGRIQTLLAHPTAQQGGIGRDLPQIPSTWGARWASGIWGCGQAGFRAGWMSSLVGKGKSWLLLIWAGKSS